MTDAAEVLNRSDSARIPRRPHNRRLLQGDCISRPPRPENIALVRVRLRRTKSRLSPVPAMPSRRREICKEECRSRG